MWIVGDAESDIDRVVAMLDAAGYTRRDTYEELINGPEDVHAEQEDVEGEVSIGGNSASYFVGLDSEAEAGIGGLLVIELRRGGGYLGFRTTLQFDLKTGQFLGHAAWE